MLQYIRKKAESRAFKVLAGILAFTFLFCFGMFDVIRRWTGKDYVVKIGKVKISPTMFEVEKAKRLNMLRAQGKSVDEEKANLSILHQIIWESVMDQAATEFGFKVSDGTIRRYIAGMNVFHDEKGNFNPFALRRFLGAIHISEPLFIELCRKDIKNALIQAPLKYVSVNKLLSYHIKANMEKRVMAVVEIDPNSLKISEKCEESELVDFYEQNTKLFMVDETRSFSIVTISEDEIAKTIEISEDEKREYFETSPDREDRTYEEMKAEIEAEIHQNKLQVALEEYTRQVEDALMGGEELGAVAKKFGLHIVQVKDATAIDGEKKVRAAIKNLSCPGDVVRMAFSIEDSGDSSFSEALDGNKKRILWLVHVDSIVSKHVAGFESVKKKVQKEWLKKQQHDKAVELAKSLCDEVKDGQKTLEQAAAAKGLKLLFVTKPFDKDGNLVLVKKSQEDKASAKDKAADKNSKKKKDNKNKNRNGKGKNKGNNKEEIKETVKEENQEIKKTPQDEYMESISKEFASQIFANGRKAAFWNEKDGKIYIVQLKEIIPSGEVTEEEQNKQQLDLMGRVIDDIHQQLVRYFSGVKYEIKMNQELIDRTTGTKGTSPTDGLF